MEFSKIDGNGMTRLHLWQGASFCAPFGSSSLPRSLLLGVLPRSVLLGLDEGEEGIGVEQQWGGGSRGEAQTRGGQLSIMVDVHKPMHALWEYKLVGPDGRFHKFQA